MSNIICTKLEHLPNELLYEILEYIDVRDLFYGFLGLNQRINFILQNLQNLSLALEKFEPLVMSVFAKQITQLVVNTWQDIDLRQFPYLQSLILRQVTGNQLHQIRSEYMPYLVYLSTSSIPEFSLMPQLAERIFTNDMPNVQHIDFGHVHVPYVRTWSQAPSLRSISIRSTNPTIVPFVLMASPNITYLRIEFLYNTIAIFQNPPSIKSYRLNHFILVDPYHTLSYNHVYVLLTFIPNTRKIELEFSCKIPLIRFFRTLVIRLPRISQFDCNIDDKSNDQLTDIETIRQIHPCFNRIQSPTNDFNFRTFSTQKNL